MIWATSRFISISDSCTATSGTRSACCKQVSRFHRLTVWYGLRFYNCLHIIALTQRLRCSATNMTPTGSKHEHHCCSEEAFCIAAQCIHNCKGISPFTVVGNASLAAFTASDAVDLAASAALLSCSCTFFSNFSSFSLNYRQDQAR